MNPNDLLSFQSHLFPPVLPFAIFLGYFSKELQKQKIVSTFISKQKRVKTGLTLFIKDVLKKKCSYLLPPIVIPKKLLVERLPDPPFFTHALPRFFWHQNTLKKPYEYVEPKPLICETKEEILLEKNAYNLLAFAKSFLPLIGTIKQDSKSLIYVSISDAFLDSLLPLLPQNAERPFYSEYKESKGAHFVLMLPSEVYSRKGLGKLKEIGQEISFIPTGVYAVVPESWPEMDKVWILTLHSPQAEAIRQRYLLPSKIQSHDFHIVIGVKTKNQFAKESPKKEIFRINISCYAA